MQTVLFLLGELDDDDIDWMLETGNRQTCPVGTVLIYEGQAIDNLYILLEGAMSITTRATQGQEIASLSTGDVVGEMSFIDTRPPSATVTAKQDSLVLTIPREQLAIKLRLDIAFAARFYRALAVSLSSRLRVTVRQLQMGGAVAEADDLLMDDLAKDALDNVLLAKARLDWLLRRLKDGE